MDTRIPSQG